MTATNDDKHSLLFFLTFILRIYRLNSRLHLSAEIGLAVVTMFCVLCANAFALKFTLPLNFMRKCFSLFFSQFGCENTVTLHVIYIFQLRDGSQMHTQHTHKLTRTSRGCTEATTSGKCDAINKNASEDKRGERKKCHRFTGAWCCVPW